MKRDLIIDGNKLGEAIIRFFETSNTFIDEDTDRLFTMSKVYQVEIMYTPSTSVFCIVFTHQSTRKRVLTNIDLPSVRLVFKTALPKPCDYSEEIDLSGIEVSESEPVTIGEMLIKFGRALKKEYIIQQIAFNRHLQGRGLFSGLISVWESWFRAHPQYEYSMRIESILNEHLRRALENRPGWTIRYDGSAVYE
jgi:hypothetical protein